MKGEGEVRVFLRGRLKKLNEHHFFNLLEYIVIEGEGSVKSESSTQAKAFKQKA
jgi:hypothetical protein